MFVLNQIALLTPGPGEDSDTLCDWSGVSLPGLKIPRNVNGEP